MGEGTVPFAPLWDDMGFAPTDISLAIELTRAGPRGLAMGGASHGAIPREERISRQTRVGMRRAEWVKESGIAGECEGTILKEERGEGGRARGANKNQEIRCAKMGDGRWMCVLLYVRGREANGAK